jgi:GTP-binding protein LepA
LLDAVCSEVNPPERVPDDGETFRAKVIDSWFEIQRGVVCLLQVLSGKITEGDRILVLAPSSASMLSDKNNKNYSLQSIGSQESFSVQDIGLVLPQRLRTKALNCGQMGYAIIGMRDPRQACPGSYLILYKDLPYLPNIVLPVIDGCSSGRSASSALYASVHPRPGDGFDELSAAVERLALNDTGLEINRTTGAGSADGGPFLGPGLRVGFQGLLHVEVFRQRLKDEFGLEAIVTPPKVPYIIKYLSGNRTSLRLVDALKEVVVEDLSQWPQPGERYVVFEPMVNARVVAPMEHAGNVMDLIKRKRGKNLETRPIDEKIWLFTSCMPWGEVITDFHDELKNITAGYGSFDISEAEPSLADLVKVEIVLNGDVVEPLGFVCHKDNAHQQGKVVCKKLQGVLPRQQFIIIIQAKIGAKIIASERIQAYRKDVLTKAGKTVGGGDISRKKKLLQKQKQGKKRQQTSGKVSLSQEAFNSVISRS